MVIAIIQNLVKNYLTKKVITDNIVFRLHYQFTVVILVLFGMLATSNQLFSNPIVCSIGPKNFDQNFINAYCWIHPTFIVNQPTPDDQGTEINNPDTMKSYGLRNSKENGEHKQYNNYYQWVSTALFVQALLIYLPRFIWLDFEKRINSNLQLDVKVDRLDQQKIERTRDYIIDFLIWKPKMCRNSYYYLHVFLEACNLLIVLAQFAFMNFFLNSNFSRYGFKVLQFENWSYELYFDPMTRAFPKLAKCLFYSYGSSGNTQKTDFLCVLPYNTANEKIYLFLWFWFQILILAGVMNLIYRLLLGFSRELRCARIRSQTECPVNRAALSSIVNNVSVGEWYILDVLANNLDITLFDSVVTGINEVFDQKRELNNRR